ncbi:MAG: dimethylarginine dimethylaminohydrolase family protein [Nitrospinales bacterium]
MKSALLMCTPDYFGVRYVINPWMEKQVGKINRRRAKAQWTRFYKTLSRHARVELIEPRPNMPDLVFTANAGILRGNKFILSRFRHQERQPEEPVFKTWFKDRGYKVIEQSAPFEGAGDALFQPGQDLLWAGYGLRTDRAAHATLSKEFRTKVVSLRLIDKWFYHLDTCLCPLRNGQVMYYPGAFDPDSVKRIEENTRPENRIAVSAEDAAHFSCNAVLVKKNIFLNFATSTLKRQLEQAGYTVHIQPVTEFLKSGGANKCLTIEFDEDVSKKPVAWPTAA